MGRADALWTRILPFWNSSGYPLLVTGKGAPLDAGKQLIKHKYDYTVAPEITILIK